MAPAPAERRAPAKRTGAGARAPDRPPAVPTPRARASERSPAVPTPRARAPDRPPAARAPPARASEPSAPTPDSLAAAWAPAEPPQPQPAPRKKLSTTAIVLIVVAAVQLGPMLVMLPAMLLVFTLADGSDDLMDPLAVQLVVLGALAVLLAFSLFALRGQATRPGLPAGPRSAPYGLAGGGGLGDRLRRLEPRLHSAHRAVLWSLVGAVGLAALGILAAVVAGPEGPSAALFGLLLLGGWLLTLLAYLAGGYRFLAPAAAALLAFGLVLHADAVARAWGAGLPGSVHALGLLALLWLALAPSIEACARAPSAAWRLAAWAAAALTAAVPVLLLSGLQTDGSLRLAAGLSSAGAILALAGGLRLVRLSAGWKGAAAAVAVAWAASSVASAFLPEGLRDRVLAATVLVVLVALVATLTAFLIQRPRGVPA
jgi:hypothetical protein